MSLLSFVKLFIPTLLAFLALDMLWLGIIMKDFYRENLWFIARKSGESLSPIWWAAFVFYVLIIIGLIVFVLPKVKDLSMFYVFLYGGLFGLIAYATYDLTNYSAIADWPLKLVFIDMAWGFALCGMTSIVMFLVDKKFF